MNINYSVAAAVVEGNGVMQAVKIGDASIYGQLTQELKDDERDSPLKLKLKGLADKISQFGYAGGIFNCYCSYVA